MHRGVGEDGKLLGDGMEKGGIAVRGEAKLSSAYVKGVRDCGRLGLLQ